MGHTTKVDLEPLHLQAEIEKGLMKVSRDLAQGNRAWGAPISINPLSGRMLTHIQVS